MNLHNAKQNTVDDSEIIKHTAGALADIKESSNSTTGVHREEEIMVLFNNVIVMILVTFVRATPYIRLVERKFV